jgi:IclR helix-turn-helix domain
VIWTCPCVLDLSSDVKSHPTLSQRLASVDHMPARPHRTVDRVVQILDTMSLNPRGVTLAELATALEAAKSSVQELTNGLLARGYLIEEVGTSSRRSAPASLAPPFIDSVGRADDHERRDGRNQCHAPKTNKPETARHSGRS